MYSGGNPWHYYGFWVLLHAVTCFRSRHFDLKSPITLSAIFGAADAAADDDDNANDDGYDNECVLEHLHSHLDSVEAALMQGVRARSGEFFSAVDQLQVRPYPPHGGPPFKHQRVFLESPAAADV